MGQIYAKEQPLTFQKKLVDFKHTMKDCLLAFQNVDEKFRESEKNRGSFVPIDDQTTIKERFKSKLKSCQELLSQREKLLKFVASSGFTVGSLDLELRLILCEISVSAIQLLFDYSSKWFLTDEILKYKRLIRILNLSIKSPEQFEELVELLKVTEDGSTVKFILDQLMPRTAWLHTSTEVSLFGVDPIEFLKAQPALFDSAWFQKYSRSAAVSNVLLCGKFLNLELEQYTHGVPKHLLATMERIRPEVLQLCRYRGSQLTPLLMVFLLLVLLKLFLFCA